MRVVVLLGDQSTKFEETSAVCERENVLITFREAGVGPKYKSL